MGKAHVCLVGLKNAIVFLGFLTVGGAAHAEPPPKRDPTPDLRAKGNAALKTGHVHDALKAWREAWYAGPNDWSLACDIGRAEMALENDLAAVDWLTRCVRLTPRRLDPTTIERGRRGVVDLNLARSRVAELLIDADDGATITLNGAPIGVAPLAHPVYAKPGEIQIEARTQAEAKKGAPASALKIKAEAAAQHKVYLRTKPPGSPLAHPVVPAPNASAERRAFGWWPVIFGTGASLAAAGMGVAFNASSIAAQREMASVGAAILRRTRGGCSSPTNDDQCFTYEELDARRVLHSDMAVGAFIVAGVAGAATITYAIYENHRVSITPTLGGATARFVW